LRRKTLLRVGPCTAISRRTAVRLGGTWPSSWDINAVTVLRTPR